MNQATCLELIFVLMRLPHVRAVLFVGGHGHCTHVHDNSCTRERYSCVAEFSSSMKSWKLTSTVHRGGDEKITSFTLVSKETKHDNDH